MKNFTLVSLFALFFAVPAFASDQTPTSSSTDIAYSEFDAELDGQNEFRERFPRRQVVCFYGAKVPGRFTGTRIFRAEGQNRRIARIKAERRCERNTFFARRCRFLGCRPVQRL